MSEIKPWMRRAALAYIDRTREKCAHPCDDCFAEAIAAHAPPTQRLANALEACRDAVTFAADCDTGESGDADTLADLENALSAYADWLKREEATDAAGK